MKNKLYKNKVVRATLELLFIALLFLGCDNSELDLDIKFLFSPQIELVDKATIDEKSDLNIKIESNIYKEGYLDHQFQFNSDKKGKVISPNGDTIRMNTYTPIKHDGQFHKYQYIGEEVGLHKINFLFKNSKNVEVSQNREILINYADYSLTADTGNIGSINVPKKIILTLSKGKETSKSTYKLKAVKENLVGQLYNEKKEELEDGVFKEITPNTYEYTFIPSASTENGVIKFEAEDNHGLKKYAEVSLRVSKVGFDFELTPASNTGLMNKPTGIAFKITPLDASTASKNYQMKFSTSGEGTLNAKTQNEGYFDVKEGEFTLPYIGISNGEHNVVATVKDEFGGTISKEFKIDIEAHTFDFAVTSQNLNPIIGENNILHFIITTPIQNTQNYKMKYQVLEGGAILQSANGTNINPNTLFELSANKEFTHNFKTTQGGKTRIKFTIINSDGYQVEKEIEFNTQIPEFTFSASALKTEQSINEPNTINYLLSRIGGLSQTFQIKFETNGEGTLNGNEKNVWFDITEGGGNLKYIPTTAGEHTLKLTAKSKTYGFEVIQTINISVGYHKFNFDVANNKANWILNESNSLSFSITPIDGDNGQTYQMAYKVLQGEGILEGFEQNVFKNVSKGTFNNNFKATKSGVVELLFTAKNTDGTKVEQKIILNIDNPEFKFSTTLQGSNINVGNPANVIYSLISLSGEQTFQVKFETSGDGKLNGFSEGIWFNAESGDNKTFEFIPTSIGDHQVTVTAKNQYGVEKTSTFSVQTKAQTFDFTASSPSSGTINTPIEQTFTIAPNGNDAGQEYELKFSVEGGSAKLNGNLAGTWIRVNKGEFKFPYLPTSAGNHRITYTVKNTAGTEVTRNIDINVAQPDFNFTGALIKSSTTINEPVSINFDIEALGQDLGSSYKMSFVASKSATLNGKTQNVWFDVQKGGFTFDLLPTEIGDNDITVKVKNDYGVEKTITLKLQVVNYNFSFTAVSTNNAPNVDETVPVNINITPIGNDAGQVYSMQYIILEGQVDVEGYTAGVYQSVSKGDSSVNIIPRMKGASRIKFIAKNSAGSVQEQIISFNSSLPDFDFTVVTSKYDLYTGEALTFDVLVTPTTSTPSQTFEMKYETQSGAFQLENFSENRYKPIQNTLTIPAKILKDGINEITFYAKNQFGVVHQSTIYFDVKKLIFEINNIVVNSTVVDGVNGKSLLIGVQKTPKYSNFVKYRTFITNGNETGLVSTMNIYKEGSLNDSNFIEIPIGDFRTFKTGQYTMSVQLMDEYGNQTSIKEIEIEIPPLLKLISGKSTLKYEAKRESSSSNTHCVISRDFKGTLRLENISGLKITKIEYEYSSKYPNTALFNVVSTNIISNNSVNFEHNFQMNPKRKWTTGRSIRPQDSKVSVKVTLSNNSIQSFEIPIENDFVVYDGNTRCSQWNP